MLVGVRLLMLVIAMATLAHSRRLYPPPLKSSTWVANATPTEGAQHRRERHVRARDVRAVLATNADTMTRCSG